jgi:hypothetical protein
MSSGQLTREYRTDLLSLAVYLNLEGHCHQGLEMRGGKAVWVFLETEELTELVNNYQLDMGSIEPRSFVEELARCRKELFEFLDKHKSPNGKD